MKGRFYACLFSSVIHIETRNGADSRSRVGAVVESLLLPSLDSFAIMLSPVLLMAALIIMFYNVAPDDGDTYIEG